MTRGARSNWTSYMNLSCCLRRHTLGELKYIKVVTDTITDSGRLYNKGEITTDNKRNGYSPKTVISE